MNVAENLLCHDNFLADHPSLSSFAQGFGNFVNKTFLVYLLTSCFLAYRAIFGLAFYICRHPLSAEQKRQEAARRAKNFAVEYLQEFRLNVPSCPAWMECLLPAFSAMIMSARVVAGATF